MVMEFADAEKHVKECFGGRKEAVVEGDKKDDRTADGEDETKGESVVEDESADDNETAVDSEADESVRERGSGEVVVAQKSPEELWGSEVAEVVKRRQEEIRKEREWVM